MKKSEKIEPFAPASPDGSTHRQIKDEQNVTLTDVLLAWFLGYYGVHKFYRKKIGMGVLYLFTMGLFGIGWIVDSVCLTFKYFSGQRGKENLIEDNRKQAVCIESIKTESLLQESTVEQPQKDSEEDFKEKKYRVAGTSFRTESIINVATENPDYELSKKELIESGLTDERVWEYEFYPSSVKLVPEPDNPHDPNAIKVIVDGEHIGYIKSGSCVHLLKVIQENRILDISCEMGGGPYKYVSEEYDEDKDRDVYTLDRDNTNFFAELTIREKQ